MYEIIFTVLTIVIFLTLVWYYERKTVRLEEELAGADRLIRDLVKANKAQREQLIDQQRMIDKPFKRTTLEEHVNDALAVAANRDNVITFPQAEIDRWQ